MVRVWGSFKWGWVWVLSGFFESRRVGLSVPARAGLSSCLRAGFRVYRFRP